MFNQLLSIFLYLRWNEINLCVSNFLTANR